MERGDKIEVLQDKAEVLNMEAHQFQKAGQKLKTTMWWQSFWCRLVLVLAVVMLAVVIFLAACFSNGQNCTKRQ